MLLSREKRILFVKGVKVAGTSLEALLAPQLEGSAVVTPIFPPGPDSHIPRNHDGFFNHMTALQIRDVLGDEFFTLTRFGVIRNPFEKILSFYFMQLDRSGSSYSLDDAISDCQPEQSRYCDESGNLLLTDVLRYESLASDLPRFLSRFSLSADGFGDIGLKREHRRNYSGPPVRFTDDQWERVAEKFTFDLSFYDEENRSYWRTTAAAPAANVLVAS
ncbi:hypothetical protein PWG15_24670 (plasmid) [Ensifer adhaerens]|uniref:hypothetical protein n=1 Tax=Ensifer adhaerens TaxID=106592 RepID=UPI0023A9AA20|nr:hypothetical protein [Ensifer adhaerens]WDZ80949.1 hypothetical protein PWG15_24670 [Ensifer adhaerens]